ncbi:MAG TPA: alpha-hydroxy acid oxidase [Xanthobacteraceae bacterium]|nr:alpha-hydroxy acid oxidase [Xanthobacteraceae bacterium]
MHDVIKTAEIDAPAKNPRYAALYRRYPTIHYLRARARRRGPHFAFEYMDGGAGADTGIAHNWAALDAVELVPRYGVTPRLPPIGVELFGRRFAAPFGIAPMGGPTIVWPGADILLAKAAQRARIPYTLGLVGGATIEQIAEAAPDVFWFQLYRCAKNDHAIGFDLVKRAEAAGVHVLMLTLDVPVRTTRSREVAVGLGGAGLFRPGPRMLWNIVTSPGWAWAMLQHGQPRFANIKHYAPAHAGLNDVIKFARSEVGGAFSWDEVARYRERWKGPLVVKGILHPADAERAVKLGVDGMVVSNHGGRQIEALPAPIDCLPAVARVVSGRATVLMDSGIRSGTDVVRALALGASAAFAGKAFLWSLGALGPEGPVHTIDLLTDETQAALGQIGAHSPAEARNVVIRHPGALHF